MLNKELQDMFAGKSRETLIETLQFSHPMLERDIFVVKHPNPLELKLENNLTRVFQPSVFLVKIPKYEDNANLDIQIAFPIMNFEHISLLDKILRTSSDKITLLYRFYILENKSYPAIQAPFKFEIVQGMIDGTSIVLKGSLLLSVQTKTPALKMTLDNLSGLKYE